MGLSYGKIKRELATYFGLTVSRKTLQAMVSDLAGLFGPAYKQLLDLMRQQAVLHVDETGWRVDGDNHWLWIFVNDVVTLYVISRSRASKVPKALLGPHFGSRSRHGVHAFALLLSLIRTWERQGDDFFSLGLHILSSSLS